MKRFFSLIFLLCFLLGITNLPKASAAVSEWQKGISIYPRSAADFSTMSMHDVLVQIRSDNANYVTLVIPYHQKTKFTSAMYPGADTPSDEALTQAIQWAHDLNLKVSLKVHLDAADGSWRANIDPSDRNTWYANYENLLMHYVAIAKAYDVEQICIGTELIRTAAANIHSDNTARWEKIIADIRNVYSGALTYSANWGPSSSSFANEKDHIDFWPKLDFIGVSAYAQLKTSNNSVESLTAAWDKWYSSDIAPLSQKFNKPILFTEIGYRSTRSAHLAPYDFQGKGKFDAQEQVNAYEAMFKYWNDVPGVAGVSVWDFYADPSAGGQGNTDYTPQNKPAEQVLKKWFTPPPVATTTQVTQQPNDKTFLRQNLDNLNNLFRSLLGMI